MRKNCISGFTLIEVLTTMFIIVLLSGIIFANYRQSGQRFALQRSANKLAQDIRRAQEMAMSTKVHNGINPPGGYGVYFKSSEPNKYIIFADINKDFNYDPGDGEMVEEINLKEEVKILQLAMSEDGDSTVTDPLYITFTPPDPAIKVNGYSPKFALIYLKIGEEIRLVRVNPLGLVTISSDAKPTCYCAWKTTGCTPDGSGHCSPPCPGDVQPFYFWDCCCYEYTCSPVNCCLLTSTCPPDYPSYCECVGGGKMY
jgi:prepilin-type N-terminal cleavage/methylation domain-containing protein